MKTKLFYLLFTMLIIFSACEKQGSDASGYTGTGISAGGGSGSGGSGGAQVPAGVITAGEWNDLDNWNFWDSIISMPKYNPIPGIWQLYNKNRVSVHVSTPGNSPVANAVVQLKYNGAVVFSARTDNRGDAELWADLFTSNTTDFSFLSIDVNNGSKIVSNVKPYSAGINQVTLSLPAPADIMQVAFVVDATGSMSDEISYLKNEVLDVINRARNDNPGLVLQTGSVFYRDLGDDYVTRVSDFTTTSNTTINFIKDQNAGGGGDWPEAVDIAMEKSVNELTWLPNAKTRIMFMILDAPPHKESSNISKVQLAIAKAAEKGIKIIPVSASGIDKETEFLLRFMALSTNGTYVFITNDSGIGNTHLEATVGPYQVEYLNNLMVRLINKYAQ